MDEDADGHEEEKKITDIEEIKNTSTDPTSEGVALRTKQLLGEYNNSLLVEEYYWCNIQMKFWKDYIMMWEIYKDKMPLVLSTKMLFVYNVCNFRDIK